jgi:hypothetical protein
MRAQDLRTLRPCDLALAPGLEFVSVIKWTWSTRHDGVVWSYRVGRRVSGRNWAIGGRDCSNEPGAATRVRLAIVVSQPCGVAGLERDEAEEDKVSKGRWEQDPRRCPRSLTNTYVVVQEQTVYKPPSLKYPGSLLVVYILRTQSNFDVPK